MARSNRRQFVWARSAGVLTYGEGSDPGLNGVDLLQLVRERHGEAVVRGATVMGIKGYIRPNGTVEEAPALYGRLRAGVRVVDPGDLDGEVSDDHPINNPEADWMLFQQVLYRYTTEDVAPIATDNVRANQWAVETRASRKIQELGQSLGLMAGASLTDPTLPVPLTFWDYDLSIGLKLP